MMLLIIRSMDLFRSDEREFASKLSDSKTKKKVPLAEGEKDLVDTFVSLESSDV